MKSDAKIQQDVIEELQCRPSINALHVGVGVHDGLVTLVGHVGSYTEKGQAESAARAVQGVEDIVNEIAVRSTASRCEFNVDNLGPLASFATYATSTLFEADFEAAWRRRTNSHARNAMK